MTPTAEITLPDPTKPFTSQDPVVLLACTVWGEARGEGMDGKIAVACVVRNRVGKQGKYGWGFTGVILRPHQFSCFDAGDPNHDKLLEPLKHGTIDTWQACLTAAHVVYWGSQTDITGGACFYYSKPLTSPPRKHDGTLAWGSVAHCIDIGGLSFWREA